MADIEATWSLVMTKTLHHARPARGLTLIETLIALTVSSVTVSMALPGFQAARERRAVDAAAAQLATDIQFARSLAVTQQQSVRISFTSTASANCYVIHTGSARDCTCASNGSASCTGDALPLRSVSWTAADAVALRSNVGSILIDASRGTVTPTATVQVQGPSSAALKVIVNILGRVRTCTTGSPTAGLPAC